MIFKARPASFNKENDLPFKEIDIDISNINGISHFLEYDDVGDQTAYCLITLDEPLDITEYSDDAHSDIDWIVEKDFFCVIKRLSDYFALHKLI